MPGFPVVCSLSPRALSNSCPPSQWCHPTILLSVPHFSFCPQSFPASGSFLMSWPFTSHGQRIRASASVLPVNIQGWFPLGLTCLISLLSKGLSKSSPAPLFKISNSSALRLLYGPTLTSVHDYWKNHSFDCTDLCWQSDVSAFWYAIIAFLPRSKCFLISWLQSLSTWFWSPGK